MSSDQTANIPLCLKYVERGKLHTDLYFSTEHFYMLMLILTCHQKVTSKNHSCSDYKWIDFQSEANIQWTVPWRGGMRSCRWYRAPRWRGWGRSRGARWRPGSGWSRGSGSGHSAALTWRRLLMSSWPGPHAQTVRSVSGDTKSGSGPGWAGGLDLGDNTWEIIDTIILAKSLANLINDNILNRVTYTYACKLLR